MKETLDINSLYNLRNKWNPGHRITHSGHVVSSASVLAISNSSGLVGEDDQTTWWSSGVVDWSVYEVPPAISARDSEDVRSSKRKNEIWESCCWVSCLINNFNQDFKKKLYCSVHVRRTDKVGTEAAFHSIDEYMLYVADFFDKLEIKEKIKVRRVYLASDDPSVLPEAKKK